MIHAHAEAEGAHAQRVDHLVAQLPQHDRGATSVAGVEVAQLGVVVAATAPCDGSEICAVGRGEVVKRAEQVCAQRVPQTEFDRGPTTEELAHVHAVCPLGCRRQGEELARAELIQEAPVGPRFGVVELVDHDDRVGVRFNLVDTVRGQRLDAGEYVPPALRPRTADVELAEVSVIENFAVSAQRLFENLPAVGDKEKGGTVGGLLSQPAVVQGGDDGLARAGGGHDQVAVTVMDDSFDLEGIQHVLLIGKRSNVEARQRQRCSVVLLVAGRLGQCVVKSVAVALRVVGLEAWVIPIRVKRAAELLQQCRGRHPGEPDVPLDTVQQCSPRQVRRTDVSGVVGRRAPEHPRLGM